MHFYRSQSIFTLLPVRVCGAFIDVIRRKGVMRGDQLFDIITVGIFSATVLFLWSLNAGTIYFWMKDLTQEFLKLHVMYSALELGDKVR